MLGGSTVGRWELCVTSASLTCGATTLSGVSRKAVLGLIVSPPRQGVRQSGRSHCPRPSSFPLAVGVLVPEHLGLPGEVGVNHMHPRRVAERRPAPPVTGPQYSQ